VGGFFLLSPKREGRRDFLHGAEEALTDERRGEEPFPSHFGKKRGGKRSLSASKAKKKQRALLLSACHIEKRKRNAVLITGRLGR